MSESVIKVRGLGKSYQIAGKRKPYRTVRETLTETALSPFRRITGGGTTIATGASDTFWALKDVSFEINAGEVVGIIGRNGAGKSTLLKVLSRITDPTEGEVELNGRVGSLLEVGTGFHPELTGRENIYLNGAILGMTRGEISKKFDEIVAFAETERFLDTPVKFYSSGMYTRLAFAVAAHLEPEILVVDEVLAVGDASFQKKCLGKMQEVGRDGRTVLFVSHSTAAIVALCQRCVMLAGGKVQMVGSTDKVIGQYQQLAADLTSPVADLRSVSRRGSLKAKFERISLSSPRATQGDAGTQFAISTGGELVIDLEIAAVQKLPSANVAVIIYDSNGYRLVDVNTAIHGQFLSLEPGQKATVQLTLHDIRLRPGDYPIGLWLGRGGIEDVDMVENARVLTVQTPSDDQQHTEVFPGPYQCRSDARIQIDGIAAQ